MSKEGFKTEAEFRRKLLALRLEFMKMQMEITREMIPFVFGDTLPKEEKESLHRLLTETSDDFRVNMAKGEELLLSDGPLLVMKNPGEQH